MKKLSADNIKFLHSIVEKYSGGENGLRDVNLVESTLGSVYQAFDGTEMYPTALEKAARLCFGLISNHAFVDGNKRIGVLAMLVLLRLEGERVLLSDSDVVIIGMSVASCQMSYQDLLGFLRKHVQK